MKIELAILGANNKAVAVYRNARMSRRERKAALNRRLDRCKDIAEYMALLKKL